MAAQMIDAQCGNCSQPALPGVQFCAGCGQPLWHKCTECKTSVLLTQKFCNGCGLDLHAVLDRQFASLRSIHDRALEQGKLGKFKEAIRLASMLVEPKDYRFNAIAAEARTTLDSLEQQRTHWDEELVKLERRAARYQESGRLDDIVKLLSPVPPGVLTEELAQLLKKAQSSTSALSACKSELKAALAEKRYDDALGCLTQIVEQSPGNEKYQKQLDEVAHKVLSKAEKYGSSGKLAKAIQLLKSIPSSYQNDKYQQLINGYEEVVFLRLLLAKATFMNPTVISSLVKLEELTPGDPLVASLKEKASKLRKKGSKGADLWPEWMKPEKGMLGLPIVPTRIPANFPGSRPECLEKSGSQFWVAIGLALQGLTQPMPKGDFLVSKEAPKGILSILGRKKSKVESAWGIDIGDSGIRAVLMKLTGEPAAPVLDTAVMIKFDQKSGGAKNKLDKEAAKDALSKLAKDHVLKDIPVMVNYPGSELIARFIKLPPVSGKKKYDEFVQQDGKANIPMPMDLLLTAYHIADVGEDDRASPGAIYVAGRKADVEARKLLIDEAGVKIAGIQPEPFAIWNTLQFLNASEFKPAEQSDEFESSGRYQAEADLVVDVGLNRSNILIAHQHGVWFRTLDWGLSSLTSALCTSQNLTHGDADKLRREISRATFYHQPLEAMQAACAVPKRELERSAYVARDAIGELRFRRAILIGGGAAQPFLSSWLNSVEF